MMHIMKKLSLLLSLTSMIILSWCTTTLTDPWSDTTTATDTHTTVSSTTYFYPEDTLYAYLARRTTLGSGENIGECYALRENPVSEDDVKAGLYSWVETDLDPSLWMNYSVSEIHNDHCRGWSWDPQTSPTIGRFLVVWWDIYTEDPETWWYNLESEDWRVYTEDPKTWWYVPRSINNTFRKNQHIYQLDEHPAEKIIFDYLQKESNLLTGESAQHCFWLSDYETSSEQISQEIFSPLPWDQLAPLQAFTAHRSQNKHCRWGVEIDEDSSNGRWTFAIIGNTLYRQLRGDEIDKAWGERWTLIQ